MQGQEAKTQVQGRLQKLVKDKWKSKAMYNNFPNQMDKEYVDL